MTQTTAEWTPREIVRALDRHVVGQEAAKRAVAIALRNRYRRRLTPPAIRNEIQPTNILMIGPTGVGKTEIARRLSRLSGAPFLKVEASKFTEVGYVGRDVESMVRDLVEISIAMVRSETAAGLEERARKHVEERLLNLLLPRHRRRTDFQNLSDAEWDAERDAVRLDLRAGRLADRVIEVDVLHSRAVGSEVNSEHDRNGRGGSRWNADDLGSDRRKKRRRLTISEALAVLCHEETRRLVDMDDVVGRGLERAESMGILFIDEIDKIAGPRSTTGPDVSREGVQRDLLPIVEGSSVSTRHGVVRTDHILFIAAGAFHAAKPSDLLPELQGRFPIRVELQSLGASDFLRVLTEPENSLVRQYEALLAADGVQLEIRPEALARIAALAHEVNQRTVNIGARRLQTLLHTLLEDALFHSPEAGVREIVVDAAEVERRLGGISADQDLSRYIL